MRDLDVKASFLWYRNARGYDGWNMRSGTRGLLAGGALSVDHWIFLLENATSLKLKYASTDADASATRRRACQGKTDTRIRVGLIVRWKKVPIGSSDIHLSTPPLCIVGFLGGLSWNSF